MKRIVFIIILLLTVLCSCQRNTYEVLLPKDAEEFDNIKLLMKHACHEVSYPGHIEGYGSPRFFSYGKGSSMAYYSGEKGELLFAKHEEKQTPSSSCVYQKIESSLLREVSHIREEGYLSDGKVASFIGLLDDSDDKGYRYRELAFLGDLMSETSYFVFSDKPQSKEFFVRISEGFR